VSRDPELATRFGGLSVDCLSLRAQSSQSPLRLG
jgi:hypothetical protein